MKIFKAEIAQESPITAEVSDENFDREQLIQIAVDNQKNSYAPYSNYNVSAAVLMDSGKIYTGVNVENASYPAGICAERNAIFHAVQCGERNITAIAIAGGFGYEVHDYCAPCGICRQVMREFCGDAFEIVFSGNKTVKLKELLPLAFSKENF